MGTDTAALLSWQKRFACRRNVPQCRWALLTTTLTLTHAAQLTQQVFTGVAAITLLVLRRHRLNICETCRQILSQAGSWKLVVSQQITWW